MVGAGAVGSFNARAVCVLKCKCPLLWASGTLIIMSQHVRSDFDRTRSNGFMFLSCLITNQCCLES